MNTNPETDFISERFSRRSAAGRGARQCSVGEVRSTSCFSLWRSI